MESSWRGPPLPAAWAYTAGFIQPHSDRPAATVATAGTEYRKAFEDVRRIQAYSHRDSRKDPATKARMTPTITTFSRSLHDEPRRLPVIHRTGPTRVAVPVANPTISQT